MPQRPLTAETPPSPSPRSTRLTPPSSLFPASAPARPSLSPSSSIKVGLSLASGLPPSPIASVSPTTSTDTGGYFSFMRGALGPTNNSAARTGTASSPIVVPRRRGSDSVSTTSSSSPPGAAGILAALSSAESPQKPKTTTLEAPAYLATLSPQSSYKMPTPKPSEASVSHEHEAASPSPAGSGGSSSFSTPATAPSLAPPSVSSVQASASPTPPSSQLRTAPVQGVGAGKIPGSKSMPSVMRPGSVSFGATTATASTATASASLADGAGGDGAAPMPRSQSAKARLSDMLAQKPRTVSNSSGDRREGRASSRSPSISSTTTATAHTHAHAQAPAPAPAAPTRAAEPVLTRSSVTTTQGAVERTRGSGGHGTSSSLRTDSTHVLSSTHHTHTMPSDRARAPRATSPTSVSASYDSDTRYSTAESGSVYRTPPDGSPRASTPTPATVRPSNATAAGARRKKRTGSDDKAKIPFSKNGAGAERKPWVVPTATSDTERELELNDVDAAQSGPSTPTHVADEGTDPAEAELKRLQMATNAPDADDHYAKHAYMPPYEPRRRVRPVPAPAVAAAATGHSSSSSVLSPSSSFYSDDHAMTVSSGGPQRYAVTLVAALSSGRADALPFARRRVELELLWDTAPPPSYWDYVPGARYVPQWRLRAAGADSGRDDTQRPFVVRAVRALPVVGSVAAWL